MPPVDPQSELTIQETVFDPNAQKAAQEATTSELLVIPTIPGYRLELRLGRGTFGEVWKATRDDGIAVAVKLFAQHVPEEAILREVQRLFELGALPGIVQIYTYESHDPPHLAMKVATHGSLADRIKEGPLPLSEALRLWIEMLKAVAILHDRQLYHCDLKPENILLDGNSAQPTALVADFGQACLVQENRSGSRLSNLGTFYYMAPEQAGEKAPRPSPRWDVYALGGIFHAMLIGEPAGKDSELAAQLKDAPALEIQLETYARLIADRAPRHRTHPEIDERLAAIVDRCVAVSPEDRFRDADAVLEALMQREAALRAEVEERQEAARRAELQRVRKSNFNRLALLVRAGFWAAVVVPLLVGLLGTLTGWLIARDEIARVLRNEAFTTGDQSIADVVAESLQTDLQSSIAWLESSARECERSPRTKSWLRDDAEAQAAARAWLLEKYSFAPHIDQPEKRHVVLARLSFVRAADGVILANTETPTVDPRRLMFRDWFNGQGRDEFEHQKATFAPVTRTHLSIPYQGIAANRGASLINITVPIHDGSSVIGLLVGHIEFNAFSKWIAKIRPADGAIAVVDHRGFCVHHDLAQKAIEPKREQNPTPFYQGLLESSRSELSLHHGTLSQPINDPLVVERNFVTSFSHVTPFPGLDDAGRDWYIFVLRPMDSVSQRLGKLLMGVVLPMIAVCVLLNGGVWFWMRQVLKRAELASDDDQASASEKGRGTSTE